MLRHYASVMPAADIYAASLRRHCYLVSPLLSPITILPPLMPLRHAKILALFYLRHFSLRHYDVTPMFFSLHTLLY